MKIEFDENNFRILEEHDIKKNKYRIVEFDTGYIGLQYYNEDSVLSDLIVGADDWRTILIYPNNKEIPLNEGRGFIKNNGEYFMKQILEDKVNSYKLRNNEFYEIKIYFDDDDKEDFREIVKKSEYDTLMKKLEAYYVELHHRNMESLQNHRFQMEEDRKIFKAVFGVWIILMIVTILNVVRVLL